MAESVVRIAASGTGAQSALAHGQDVSSVVIGPQRVMAAERAAQRARLHLVRCDPVSTAGYGGAQQRVSAGSTGSHVIKQPATSVGQPRWLVERWVETRARPLVSLWRVLRDRCPACGGEVDVYGWKRATCLRCGHEC